MHLQMLAFMYCMYMYHSKKHEDPLLHTVLHFTLDSTYSIHLLAHKKILYFHTSKLLYVYVLYTSFIIIIIIIVRILILILRFRQLAMLNSVTFYHAEFYPIPKTSLM